MLLSCSTCFHIFLYFYMFICYAPTYQVKFLGCGNLLGNKTDSDSDSDSEEAKGVRSRVQGG